MARSTGPFFGLGGAVVARSWRGHVLCPQGISRSFTDLRVFQGFGSIPYLGTCRGENRTNAKWNRSCALRASWCTIVTKPFHPVPNVPQISDPPGSWPKPPPPPTFCDWRSGVPFQPQSAYLSTVRACDHVNTSNATAKCQMARGFHVHTTHCQHIFQKNTDFTKNPGF